MPARLLRVPLLHFVLAGLGLFVAALAFDLGGARDVLRGSSSGGGGCDAGSDARTICVEREALLAFVQARTRMPRLEDAAAAFDASDAATRRDWTARFVREEALVREARRLGLDRSDELVRRRLVQQMEFLVEEVGEGAVSVDEEEIVAAYHAQIEADPPLPTLRFAHVFVREPSDDSGRGGDRAAFERAEALRDELERQRVPLDDAYAWGDRFLYDRVYVDRSLDEVRSHFGDAFAEALARLEPAPERWAGPIRSSHGLHLVLLAAREPARVATLDEVRSALRETLLREKRERSVERGVAALLERYRVELDDGIGGPFEDALDGALEGSSSSDEGGPSQGGAVAEAGVGRAGAPGTQAPVRAPGSSADSRHSIAPPPAS
ncbi:MAG: peptidylprolyl isomerase [Myxococcota bacterium]